MKENKNNNRIIIIIIAALLVMCLCLCACLAAFGLAGFLTVRNAVSSQNLADDRPLDEIMDGIESQVTHLRQLAPLAEIQRGVMNRDDLRDYLIDSINADMNQQDWDDYALELALFGFLPFEFDYYQMQVNLLTEQVGGFYDSETRSMFVIGDDSFDVMDKIIYAHEYTHALTDLHFDFENGMGYPEICNTNYDQCQSTLAVIEGDATLMMSLWLFDEISIKNLIGYAMYMINPPNMPVADSVPPFVMDEMLFAYMSGQSFIMPKYQQGGYAAIDQIYLNPPVSTEQILHPELYPHHFPIPVELPDFSSQLGADWRLVNQSVAGEFLTKSIFTSNHTPALNLDGSVASSAAAGWGGDSYAVYTNDQTGEAVLIYKSVWDTTGDADEFFKTLQSYSSQRWQQDASTGGWQVYQKDGQISLIHYDGQYQVIWVVATNASLSQQIQSLLQ